MTLEQVILDFPGPMIGQKYQHVDTLEHVEVLSIANKTCVVVQTDTINKKLKSESTRIVNWDEFTEKYIKDGDIGTTKEMFI